MRCLKQKEGYHEDSLLRAAIFGLMILLADGVVAEGAELKVLCAAAMRSVMNELGPRFEKTKAWSRGVSVMMKNTYDRTDLCDEFCCWQSY